MTDFYIKWLTAGIVILHILKIILNWSVYNSLNPKQKIEPGIDHPGMIFQKDGLYKSMQRNFLLFYCIIIPFWINIPKQKDNKILAWSVLVLSIIQAIGVFFYLKLLNYI